MPPSFDVVRISEQVSHGILSDAPERKPYSEEAVGALVGAVQVDHTTAQAKVGEKYQEYWKESVPDFVGHSRSLRLLLSALSLPSAMHDVVVFSCLARWCTLFFVVFCAARYIVIGWGFWGGQGPRRVWRERSEGWAWAG